MAAYKFLSKRFRMEDIPRLNLADSEEGFEHKTPERIRENEPSIMAPVRNLLDLSFSNEAFRGPLLPDFESAESRDEAHSLGASESDRVREQVNEYQAKQVHEGKVQHVLNADEARFGIDVVPDVIVIDSDEESEAPRGPKRKRKRVQKGPRSEYWMFTYNNPVLTGEEFKEKFLRHFVDCYFLVFQKEKGENGTEHFQGYCELNKRMYLEDMRKFKSTIHWETRNSTAQHCINYCTKDETRIEGPWRVGEPNGLSQGKRSDIQVAVDCLKVGGLRSVAQSHPTTFVKYYKGLEKILEVTFQPSKQDDKTCILHYGATGTGKTYKIFDEEKEFASIPTGAGQWFNGYYGQEACLFDDFDGKGWNMNTFLTMLHGYSSSQPVKGGFIQFTPKRIYFTSNLHPKQWFNLLPDDPQWPAIKRRFSKVRFYTGERQFVELDPNHPKWDVFWVGPRGSEGNFDFVKFN